MSLLSKNAEQTQQAVEPGRALLPRVDLLPPEIKEQARLRRIQYGLGGGVVAALGVVALVYVAAVGGVTAANAELETANTANTALKGETAKYDNVVAVYAQAAAAESMLTEAMGEEIRFSRYLNDLSLTVPSNVWLKELTFTQAAAPPAAGATVPSVGSVTFAGVGLKHDDVAVWLESLAGQKGYKDPYFTEATKGLIGKRAVVDYASTVTLTPDAFSRRYTASAGG